MMIKRNWYLAAVFVPVLLGMLSGPASAAPTARKASHYPGQDCNGCHKFRGKSIGNPTRTTPAKPITVPPSTGTPATAPKSGSAPAKGATPAR